MSLAIEELQELLKLNNWVVWRLKNNPDNPDKLKKVPYNPITDTGAHSNDASTWVSYEEALNKFIKCEDIKGLGFEFGTEEQPSAYAGIDLDNAFNDDRTLKPFAAEIVKIMNSYTELSPSKKGLHIIFKLKNRLSEEGYYKKHNDIECYDCKRYFTMTGDIYEASKPIEYRDKEAQQVREKYLKKSEPEQKPESRTQGFLQPIYNDSDADILRKMFNSQNGARIQALYNGDISGYKSQSEADLSLCNHLAYWTNNNANQMDSLFRQSKLYRPKWDEKHDGIRTYGEMTIQKAIDSTPDYVPDIKRPEQKQKQPEQSKKQNISDAQYLDSIFESDMKNFQRYSKRMTGFSNLDNKLVLYPALYFIGAISSLGKTTFSLQLADNFAEMGEHVLFFAFEQTRFELVTKSLARIAQPDGLFYESIPTALEIRNGRTCPEIREAMQKFKKISEHKYIIECDFMTDISVIKNTVEGYIKQNGVKPIVFIDYLQLIQSDNFKLTNTKDIVDSNVRALKKIQMDNELIMFVISSLNRQNYLTTIDFEAFKESGGIEYTADCVMGLQLAIMDTKLFETDSKATRKRKAIKAAKAQTPRYIELCILKNRYGVSNESFYFEYYSKWDKFIPTTCEAVKEINKKLIDLIPDDEEKKKPR